MAAQMLAPLAKVLSTVYLVALASLSTWAIPGQEVGWQSNPFDDKAFVKNEGQYNGLSLLPQENIKYAVDNQATKIFFSPNCLTWRFDTWEKTEGGLAGKQAKGLAPLNVQYEETNEEAERKTYTVHMQWLNANPVTQVLSWGEVPHYYNFSMGHDPANDINNVMGFRYLIYKELYPGIDVRYSFHPVEGIKYELVLHPGADVSAVAMQYTGTQGITWDNGDLFIQTPVGDILDHAPVTYYDDDHSPIASSFAVSGNTVTFALGNYDSNRKVIVDPWSISPAFVSQNIAFDVEKDNALNMYVHGGLNPYQVRKFNSAGTLLWVTNTLNNGQRPGDLAVDGAGNVYVTAGHNGGGVVPSITRITPAGAIMWNNTLAFYIEFWCLVASNAGAVVVGDSFGPPGGRFSNVDITNGNRFNTTSITPSSQDNRAMCQSPNGRFYSITSDGAANERLIGVTNTFGLLFNVAAIHNPPYNNTPLYCNGPSPMICGYNGISANNNYIYTNSGSTLYKRNANTGAVITTLAIPGGSNDNNSGLEVDACGNVYVGSMTGVYQYDSLLNFLAFQSTSGAVYDITLYTGTEVAVCGNGFLAHQVFGNGCGIPLAAEFLNFSGKAMGPVNMIEWSTASETNSSHFILERSTDGASFEAIATAQAAGNSSVKKSYSIIDHTPEAGLNYYRLKQVTANGQFAHSNTVTVESNPLARQVLVVPNPSSGKFTVYGRGPVSVYDLLGQPLLSSDECGELDLSAHPEGLYLVKAGNSISKLIVRK